MKKTTKRIQRDAQINDLLNDGEDQLQKLLDSMKHKHKNGGIFENKEHQKRTQLCIKALTEEDLDV